MILNALEVDPLRTWKSPSVSISASHSPSPPTKNPWRFYSQEMLDCCRPLSSVAEVGLTLSEFACLARCNGLAVQVFEGGGEEEFRSAVKGSARGEKGMMALSYSRKTLGQTGDGHFSPVGGYCEEEDMVSSLMPFSDE